MTVQLAIQTMSAIERQMESDQGAAFRVFQGQVMPAMKDAYRGEDEGFRSHLGASVIGKLCGRSIWYGWRWVRKPIFPAKIIRLFQRGHLEEARFIAMLLAIGVQVYQQDDNGNQYRISDIGGHFGGSGDGVGIGVPDVPNGQACLLEFKTHGEKSYLKLKKFGVRISKPEHYVQVTTYMKKMGLNFGLYCGVNKNTDEIHMEIIVRDDYTADAHIARARTIIFMKTAPDRIPNASPSLFDCTYCDDQNLCFGIGNVKVEHNCRTCHWADPREDGTWWCESKDRQLAMLFGPDPEFSEAGETFQLSKQRQLKGCKKFHTSLL